MLNLTMKITKLFQKPAKRARLDFLSKNRSTSIETSESLEIETFSYFAKAPHHPVEREIKDFWLENKNELPRLYQLARIIFGISPISAIRAKLLGCRCSCNKAPSVNAPRESKTSAFYP